jgi:hypothetical protein
MRSLLPSLLLCIVLNTSAQTVKLISATEQSWSGGMAGHHGTNYLVTIMFGDSAIPDTLWINGGFYPINIANNDTIRKIYDHKHHTITYKLYAGEAYVDFGLGGPDPIKKKQQEALVKKPHKEYAGAALITYQYKGQQQSFLIKTFEQLEGLNYP